MGRGLAEDISGFAIRPAAILRARKFLHPPIFPALAKTTHTMKHTHTMPQATQHPPTCLSLAFPIPRGREEKAVLGASENFLPSHPTSFETDSPQLTTPPPKYQLTCYPGNPAGRLPVTTATQHGRQAAWLRKVRGPVGLQSSWDVASRTGSGQEAYMPKGIKLLPSGDFQFPQLRT